MKILIFTVIALLSFNLSFAQIKMMLDTEKSEKEKIEGFMSSGFSKVMVTRIDTDEIEWQQDSSKMMFVQIDKDKNIYTETAYNPQYTRTVINLGKNVNSREIYNDKDQLQGKTLYYYDAQGNLVKRELYFGDLKAFDEIYEYEDGKLVKMKYLMSDNTVVSYSTFVFDDSNNLLEETKYNSSGDVDYKYEYTYDNKSRLTEEKIIIGKDNVTVITYSYNNKNKLSDKITRSKGKVTSSAKFTYEGDKLSEEYYDTPELKTKKSYTYKDGLLSQIKFLDTVEMNSYIWSYEYIK
jgi:hypothetical protein